MTCGLCSTLVIDYTQLSDTNKIPLKFEVKEEYPGLPQLTQNAKNGCEFCHLLVQLISEFFEVTECELARPIHFHLRNASFYTESMQTMMSEERRHSVENGVFILAIEFTYGPLCETRELYFAVFPDDNENTPCTERRMRQAREEDPLSTASVSLISSWINECMDDHDCCPVHNESFTPTRMLNVRNGIVLQHTKDVGPVQYVAFSHCWGVHGPETPVLTTTYSSIGERMTGIQMNSLPKNFQDAVTVTRALGYDYVWIDSLCIIQDSSEDWQRESAKMAEVYKYAVVTIVPTAAMSCHDGFLYNRSLRTARIPHIHPGDGIPDGKLILQWTDTWLCHFEMEIELTWWNYRGWTLQERLLSRRIIYFCPNRLYFECKIATLTRAEGGEPPVFYSIANEWNPETWAEDEDEDEDESIDSQNGDLDEPSSPSLSFHENNSTREDSPSEIFIPPSSPIHASKPGFNYHIVRAWYQNILEYAWRILSYGEHKLTALEGITKEEEEEEEEYEYPESQSRDSDKHSSLSSNKNIRPPAREDSRSEISVPPDPPIAAPTPDLYVDPYILEVWYRTMLGYSKRLLTYGEDKFPAIEGVAKDLAANCNVGRYLAGIWECDLSVGLSWRPEQVDTCFTNVRPRTWPPPQNNKNWGLDIGNDNGAKDMTLTYPTKYRAPSWSWASLDAVITWPHFPIFARADPIAERMREGGAVKILDVNLCFEGESVYGRMTSGELTLMAIYQRISFSGPRIRHQIQELPDTSYYRELIYGVGNETGEFGFAAFDRLSAPSTEVFALKLFNHLPGDINKGICSGILLTHSLEKLGAFQRIGVFVILDDHLGAFDNISPQPITLV